jgi:hypothetical protein
VIVLPGFESKLWIAKPHYHLSLVADVGKGQVTQPGTGTGNRTGLKVLLYDMRP